MCSARPNHQEIVIEPASDARRSLQRTLVRTGAVTGAFAVSTMFITFLVKVLYPPQNPVENAEWQVLREKALAEPDNMVVVEAFRKLDTELRQQYFSTTRLLNTGALIAIAAGIASIVLWVIAGFLRYRLFVPSAVWASEVEEREKREALQALIAGAFVAVLLAVGVALLARPPVDWRRAVALTSAREIKPDLQPKPRAGAEDQSSPAESQMAIRSVRPTDVAKQDEIWYEKSREGVPPISPAPGSAVEPPVAREGLPLSQAEAQAFWGEYCRQWPRFRGPEGAGISRTGPVAVTWDVPTGTGVLWKSEVPLPGNSSPIVWGDRIFLTGATPEKLAVFCYESQTGKMLWQREIPSGASPPLDPKKVAKETGFASPTPATDGHRVYAIFAPGDIVAIDYAGNVVWARNLGVPDNVYGHAASLECFGDRVFVQLDQGSRPQEGKSRLYALAGATGEIIFEIPRPVQNSWSTPIVVRWQDRWQLITASTPWLISYDPFSGTELWRFHGMEGDHAPSPVWLDGVVHVGNEYSFWFAVRADGRGDVTGSHLLWKAEENLPDLCSPLAFGDFVILLASWGMVTCYDARSGEKLWELELEGSFLSSPGFAGEYVYVIGEQNHSVAEGVESPSAICWVIRPSREGGEIVAENALGEGCTASPAFLNGRLYIRGRKHLICIASP